MGERDVVAAFVEAQQLYMEISATPDVAEKRRIERDTLAVIAALELLRQRDRLKAENERLRREKVRAFLEGREDGLKSAKAECCATVVMLGGRYEAGAERCFGAIDNKLAEARAALKGDDDG